ncbi:hypothetical protein UFOVP259_12 [uncultured Caudovirales phage]|uniref:Uncharacterized protein n=1 Tax=uncultured Caudovirales phage TaxID=2100421 RepID=A0A6J5LCG2_9CAUD|nr:hypothetical protein UFOVP259_12 [uncultured Caudovirales phage]
MNNPPAFPDGLGNQGMSLRDYFAAKAMQGMMVDVDKPNCDYIAETAYAIADAMLKARKA